MEVTNLVGNYILKGMNQDEEGSKYEGTLNLSLRSDGGLNAVWRINPDQMQYGVGFFKNEMLVINFNYVGDDDVVFRGVVAYSQNSSDILEGVWSEEAGNLKCVGVEKAYKIKTEYLN